MQVTKSRVFLSPKYIMWLTPCLSIMYILIKYLFFTILELHCYQKNVLTKVRLFLDRSCAILSSSKIVVIFNNTSADFVWISADVL